MTSSDGGGPAPRPVSLAARTGADLTAALQSASTASRQSARLIGLASYLAPTAVPLDLFPASMLSVAVRQGAIEALIAAGLARWSTPAAQAFDVAPAVQAELRERQERASEAAGLATEATRLLAAAFPHGADDPGDARNWPACQRLEDHVRAAFPHMPDDGVGSEATCDLLHAWSMYLFSRGKLDEAEPVVRRAGALAELIYGPEHPRVGQDCADLAILLYELGRTEEALPLIRRAMAIDEGAFGPEHPIVAERYNMLATLLETLGRPAEADPFIRHAVLAAERSLGPDHPDTRVYRENYEKVIAAVEAIARRDDAVEAGLAPPPPERLARPDIPPPPLPADKGGLLGRFRRKA